MLHMRGTAWCLGVLLPTRELKHRCFNGIIPFLQGIIRATPVRAARVRRWSGSCLLASEFGTATGSSWPACSGAVSPNRSKTVALLDGSANACCLKSRCSDASGVRPSGQVRCRFLKSRPCDGCEVFSFLFRCREESRGTDLCLCSRAASSLKRGPRLKPQPPPSLCNLMSLSLGG